ncbi:MAG: TetR/AcrR family transcriptional regulator [Deltaproteobacteria bacterium]|nr:TetR/AcrR family transcriptional regulator [Deltaproteobacteria bacterium]
MPRPANPTLRDDILAAALRLVEEKGAAGLTMREVAGALGYSATAIYQHFANKEDLLLALKLQAGDLLAAEMEGARGEPTLEAQLHAMGHVYLRFGLENPAYYRLMFQDAVPEMALTPEQLVRMRRSWSTMRDTLGTWVEARGLCDVDVDQEANVSWAMVHGITSLTLAGRLPFSDQREIFSLFDLAASRWVSGLLSRQPAQPRNTEKKRTRHKKPSAISNRSAIKARRTAL